MIIMIIIIMIITIIIIIIMILILIIIIIIINNIKIIKLYIYNNNTEIKQMQLANCVFYWLKYLISHVVKMWNPSFK